MAESSYGTTLTKVKSGSEPTDLVVSGLQKLGAVKVEREEIDTTTHDGSGYKTSNAGLKDGGEVAYEGIIASDSDVSTMTALFESGAHESWYTTSPSGAKWSFTAWVKSFEEGEATVDSVRTYTFTLRIVGKPTFTEASVSA